MPITDLQQIEQFSIEKENENFSFQEFLKKFNNEELDAVIHLLNKKIEPQIDCTTCANCCKTLMINITDERANNLCEHLQLNRKEFDKKFIEKGTNGMMLMNKIPCRFLQENKCMVYDYRFDGCREFPALHLPKLKERLFTVFMHYNRCPIVFNVIEELKSILHFTQ
jgi:Fe-S-cluster containining protein